MLDRRGQLVCVHVEESKVDLASAGLGEECCEGLLEVEVEFADQVIRRETRGSVADFSAIPGGEWTSRVHHGPCGSLEEGTAIMNKMSASVKLMLPSRDHNVRVWLSVSIDIVPKRQQ